MALFPARYGMARHSFGGGEGRPSELHWLAVVAFTVRAPQATPSLLSPQRQSGDGKRAHRAQSRYREQARVDYATLAPRFRLGLSKDIATGVPA